MIIEENLPQRYSSLKCYPLLVMGKYKNTSSYQGGWKNEYLTFSDSVVSEKGAIYEI